jgi:DNA-binding winged helix-turn-helix (wHTH) protein
VVVVALNIAIRKLRQGLDDNPERPHFIQTITGQGYRPSPLQPILTRTTNQKFVVSEASPLALRP